MSPIKKVISAHEHLGYGKLSFSNGTKAVYDATGQSLRYEMDVLAEAVSRTAVGVMVYPQMPYVAYSSPAEYAVSTEAINRNFFALVDQWDAGIEKYPFVYLRIKDQPEKNLRLLETHTGHCFGIKLHPDAENADVQDLLSSEILTLAEAFRLPVTAHCSRPGGRFDFLAIRRFLLDAIATRKVRFNVAHGGFFSPQVRETEFPAGVFMDISPLGIIRDQCWLGGLPPGQFPDLLAATLEKHAAAVMYGGDFPYNKQVWEDGSRHGMARTDELTLLSQVLSVLGGEIQERFYYQNACRFLAFQVQEPPVVGEMDHKKNYGTKEILE